MGAVLFFARCRPRKGYSLFNFGQKSGKFAPGLKDRRVTQLDRIQKQTKNSVKFTLSN